MDLLAKVLASIVRRIILGASTAALGVLVAKGFLSVDLTGEVTQWLSGGAVEWTVTILLAIGGYALTWVDKKKTALKLAAAKALPAGATDEDVTNTVRRFGTGIDRAIIGSAPK